MNLHSTHSAFFYGTLLHPAILRRVIGHNGNSLQACPALLRGFTRHRIRHADYPAIVPYQSSSAIFNTAQTSLSPEDISVRGVLITGLSDEDIRLLDVFEGDEYSRQSVSVHPLALFTSLPPPDSHVSIPSSPPPLPPLDSLPAPVQADTYVWVNPISELESILWEYADFVRDSAWKWVAQDKTEYAEVDRRRQMNGNIVRSGLPAGPDAVEQVAG